MRLMPVRQRLLLLGVVGVLMTVTVAAAALVCLAEVSAINRELVQVNRAQRYHQDADMMHDALHADVARAELAGLGRPVTSVAAVRRQTARHAEIFRADLHAAEALDLPAGLRTALDRLQPRQLTYIATAEAMVESALTHPGSTATARASYEAAFRGLVPTQAGVTDRLVATSARIARAAAAEKAEAERMIGLATLAALAGWVALVVWHRRSTERLQGALVREAEHRSAADLLQQTMLPGRLPTVPGVRLAARSVTGNSSQRVGGDWYDAITLPSGAVCLVVGDVVGHDLPAATTMGQLRNALRAYALEDPSPTRILARLNRAAHLLEVSDLATCVCAVLDPATRKVEWASAGHLPPLLSTASGSGRLLAGEPGPPLGVTAAAEYRRHTARLRPGDTLLLYTDGLVERRGASIDAGLADLERTTIAADEPEDVCDRLLAGLTGYGGEHDDVTLLLVRADRAGASAPVASLPQRRAVSANREQERSDVPRLSGVRSISEGARQQ
jgi:serine phosphatase RsbU (regulator of sigma subunit)